MISKLPKAVKPIDYELEARTYCESLPLEHFMEATPQAAQRAITVESFELVSARRPNVHVFNELLVQYLLKAPRKLEKVVPDNMVVISEEPFPALSSYNVPEEPAAPFWMLEYVSESNKRKDYKKSHRKYERELKVPYYLVFDPEKQDLTLNHHNGRRYVKVRANEHGRYPVKELEVEVGLHKGWVRYWYQGKLLPLPKELLQQLDSALSKIDDAGRQTEDAKRQAEESKRQAEESKRQAEESKRQAEESKRQAEESKRQTAQERLAKDQAIRQAEEAAVRADELLRRMEAMEHEIARLRQRQ